MKWVGYLSRGEKPESYRVDPSDGVHEIINLFRRNENGCLELVYEQTRVAFPLAREVIAFNYDGSIEKESRFCDYFKIDELRAYAPRQHGPRAEVLRVIIPEIFADFKDRLDKYPQIKAAFKSLTERLNPLSTNEPQALVP